MRDQQLQVPPEQDPAVRPELLEALARVIAALASPPQSAPSLAEEAADFLTPNQIAKRLGVSRETVRRLAITGVLPHTVVCQGKKKTTRRFPARFANDFAASGLGMADLAMFAARWRAAVAGGG